MNDSPQARGPWIHRALVIGFSLLLGVLVYWLLGFIVRDIGTWPGPDFREVQKQFIAAELLAQEDELAESLQDTNRAITDARERQGILRDSTDNSEKTMNRLLELQKASLQGGVTPGEGERRALLQSQELFLDNQRQYQEVNERIAALTDALRSIESRQRANQKALQERQGPVQAEWQRQWNRHQLKLAAFKLAVLLPLLLGGVMLFLRKRGTLYAPLTYAFGLAVLAKVLLVIHAHFPTRYFKYILLGAAILVTLRVLLQLIRMIAAPRRDWLLKQYREAYERFLCPICGFPIRRGPLKYLVWNRRTARKLTSLPDPASANAPEEPYACPVCGTSLFGECPRCHGVRHALLPACSHCGDENTDLLRGR